MLILLITTNREFLIYGDRGIHERVGQDFWDAARDRMARSFTQGAFAEGMAQGVLEIGRTLAQHFPRQANDVNEISDNVEFQD